MQRLLTVLCATAVLLSVSDASAARPVTAAFSGQAQTRGFDSALWLQFYSPDAAELPAASASPATDRADEHGAQSVHGKTRQGLINEMSMAKLIIEVQQHAGSDLDEGDSDGPLLSEWQIAQLQSGGTHPTGTTISQQSGPGATTLLVGLVAAIVVCGAIFSGRHPGSGG